MTFDMRGWRAHEVGDKLDRYLNVRQQAISLNIPILNQNRFLYLIGYFNQATR